MSLILSNAEPATVDQIAEVKTPEATAGWTPISHHHLIGTVRESVCSGGFEIVEEAHGLAHRGDRYFGLMTLRPTGIPESDYRLLLGLRNSHDRTFAVGLSAGAYVLVCANLSFSGDVTIARKHTTHVNRDLPGLVVNAVGQLAERWTSQGERIAQYKTREIDDAQVHDLVIRSVDLNICPTSRIPEVLHEWRRPSHEAFKPRTAWSLFNAFTTTLGGTNIATLPKRTTALHGLMDVHCGLISNN